MNEPTQETVVQLGIRRELGSDFITRGTGVPPVSLLGKHSRDGCATKDSKSLPSRRQAMQWVLASLAASQIPTKGFAGPPGPSSAAPPPVQGYGVDPNLIANHHPGDLWPLTFNNTQRDAAAALADTIIPADALGPAAGEVGVVAMIDEWISAPYPRQQADRPVVLDGLAWLDTESKKRFGRTFAQLTAAEKHTICDDICFTATAKPELRTAAHFFAEFRSLCASAYYATPVGWKAIGYVGNTPLASFDGPPQEVLDKLGVTQTVA